MHACTKQRVVVHAQLLYAIRLTTTRICIYYLPPVGRINSLFDDLSRVWTAMNVDNEQSKLAKAAMSFATQWQWWQ